MNTSTDTPIRDQIAARIQADLEFGDTFGWDNERRAKVIAKYIEDLAVYQEGTLIRLVQESK